MKDSLHAESNALDSFSTIGAGQGNGLTVAQQSDLRLLELAWPSLTTKDRRRILAIVAEANKKGRG